MKNIPKHLAIIMDGNRRWAKERGLPLFKGHHQGVKKAKEVAEWCRKRGIKILTLYVFSTENWQRPEKEVTFLMRLFSTFLSRELKTLQKEGARLLVIGDRKSLSVHFREKVEEVERLTKKNKSRTLVIALSYGGRSEIAEAVKKIIRKKIPAGKITPKQIEKHLYTAALPAPDLIIRTGGQQRLSNFLIWQSAYTELYFCQKYWPDFKEEDLDGALNDFYQRKRNLGK